MIRPLIIDDAMKAEVAEIIEYAREHHYVPGPGVEPPGDNYHHVLETDYGYRCVFSFTEGHDVLYRDLSVSVYYPKKRSGHARFPNEFAFYTLAELFGFTGWDGKTIMPPPEGWLMAKDIHYDAIRVAQEIK